MLMVVRRGREEEAVAVFRKWDLDAEVIGEVTSDGVARILESGRNVAAVPAAPLSDRSPVYERPMADPLPRDRRRLDPAAVPVPSDPGAVLSALLGSPNLCSKEWVYRRYDHTVRSNTIVRPGSDAAVVRMKGTSRALAMSADCNSRWCFLDPALGAAHAVAESARNVACSGARPLALTDCLNFGSPENPVIMGQFSAAIDGISQACRALGVPVVSGNVSFYNETDGQPIHPTPTIAVVGLLEDAAKALSRTFRKEGDAIVLLGRTLEEIGGSEYLAVLHGREEGLPPALDLAAEAALQGLLVEAAANGWIRSAHDLSDGGLAVALAEACFGETSIGAEIDLGRLGPEAGGAIRVDALLFGESASRAILGVPPENLKPLEARAVAAGVPFHVIGRVRGSGSDAMLRVSGAAGRLLETRVDALKSVWENAFPRLMGA
jgi:phosphoribosylformylglycinamidine synthase